jgi:glucose-6-phosphate isomerase
MGLEELMDKVTLWERFKGRLIHDAATGFSLDTSRLSYDDAYLARMEPQMKRALESMSALEQGAIANPDENRMVGHYWLRSPELAPTDEIRAAITNTIAQIKRFAADVHSGGIAPKPGVTFSHLLVVGIGGSALGPQFVNQALSSVADPMTISFFDNTDPDGMAKVLYSLPNLERTLVVVISKSGGTKETRNGQLVAKAAFEAAGLDFKSHFVAVTGEGSELDATAQAEGWIARFPMWDWVGGRTSECSAVGLVPFALQGFSVDQFLSGAAAMDEMTRRSSIRENPAAMMALAWYHCGCGKGGKDMVVLPYKDRLELFSRYLQQLVMESLGKELDLSGAVVNQGLAVYGNKGSTDQHAYVQQLRDGLHNFFAVFIEVLRDRSPRTRASSVLSKLHPESFDVEPGVTSGDYLAGFLLGTRSALFEKNRESVTVTVPEVSERTVGMLIALFERAVGLYASLININAYHQPGVEAGKKAAAQVLALQEKVVAFVRKAKSPLGVEEIAAGVGSSEDVETVFKIVRRLAVNERMTIQRGATLFEDRYYCA